MPVTAFFKAPKEGTLEHNVKKTFENPPTIESERLILTKILPQHASDMHEYSCDDDVTRYLTWSSHKTLKETERYINLWQKK
jgi:ribosomal-protein-alanine N-acetyltransferase